MRRLKRVLLFVFLLLPILGRAQGLLPGLIPLERGSAPASDLLYQGRLLYPEEAAQLVADLGNQIDLSMLEPAQSNLWQERDHFETQEDSLPIESFMDEVTYLSSVPQSLSGFRFSVRGSQGHMLTLMGSKTVHNILLRRSLLLKLGYRVPPIKYISKVKVNFPDNASRERFKEYIGENTLGVRWVAHEEEGADSLILHDLIAMQAEDEIYNLALANHLEAIANGRRIITSLVVPFSILNVPESINLLNWSAARIVSNHVLVDLDKATSFNCSYEDALWIFRRIEKLTRADWEEIVESTHLPASVKTILLEKLIARRNSFGDALKVDYKEIPVEGRPNNAAALVDGRITQEYFDGYARRFSYGDPESPLSSSELTDYIASVGLSSAIDAAVSGINSIPGLGTDIGARNEAELDSLIQRVEEASAQIVADGGEAITELPVSSWIFPTYRGGLNLSRNIIAGNYLGTDNLVQLVDTIGVNVNVGAFIGVVGLSPVSVGAQPNAHYTRNYAHIRPLYGANQMWKYPFKNMVVPLLKRKMGKLLDDVETLPDDEEGRAQLEEIISVLKDNLAVGESFLVTDSVGAGLSVFAGASLYGQLLRIDAGVTPSATVISRLHIYRKDEDTFQVYKDFGNIKSIMISVGLTAAGLPVITATQRYSSGSARTKFYDLNLKTTGEKTKSALAGLRDAFVKNSTSRLKKVIKPFKLEHKFKERESRVGVFWIRLNKTKSSNYIHLETPNGEVREMFRRYDGAYSGSDYTAYAFDVVQSLVSRLLNGGMNFTGIGGGNPGYSFLGKAKNRIMSFESIKGAKGFFEKPFVRLSRVWNGWTLKRKKAKKILEDIRKRYVFGFFPDQVLEQTERLFLYNINVNFVIHPEGIEFMEKIDQDLANKIFHYYSRDIYNTARTLRPNEVVSSGPSRRFIKRIKKALKAKENGDIEDYSDQILRAIAEAESELNIYGMREVFGGEKNFYSFARIDGHREGDESSDPSNPESQSIVSHSLGEFGQAGMTGPLEEVRQRTNMTEGEFLIAWILRRAL